MGMVYFVCILWDLIVEGCTRFQGTGKSTLFILPDLKKMNKIIMHRCDLKFLLRNNHPALHMILIFYLGKKHRNRNRLL